MRCRIQLLLEWRKLGVDGWHARSFGVATLHAPTNCLRADGRRFAAVLAGGVPDVAAAGALQLVRVVSLLVVYQQLLELTVVVMVLVWGERGI